MYGSVNLKEVLYIFTKKLKSFIIIPILLAAVSYVVNVYYISPVYQAKSELLVNQTITSSESTMDSRSTDVEMNLRLIETYYQIINSTRVTEKVQQSLGDTYSLDGLHDSLTIEKSDTSQIIALYARASSPERASDIVNAYAEVAQEEIFDLMDLENVQIMTLADPERINKPISPRVMLNTLLTFVIGFIFVVIYVAFFAYFRTKFYKVDDIEKYLKIPALGSFGKLQKAKSSGSRVYDSPIEMVTLDNDSMEAFRHIRTNLQFRKSVHNLTTMLITSAIEGEGKSVTSRHLAMAMALDYKKTLLIDTDIRKPCPVSGRRQRSEKLNGLTTYLSGVAELPDIIQPTDIPSLDCILKGPLPPNPTELLASERMDQLITQVEKDYDVIILDSSPLIFSDSAVLAAKVDGCIMVIEAGKTTVNRIQPALRQLETTDANILGAILNNQKEKQQKIRYY